MIDLIVGWACVCLCATAVTVAVVRFVIVERRRAE